MNCLNREKKGLHHLQLEKSGLWIPILLALTLSCDNTQGPSFQTTGKSDYKLKVTQAESEDAVGTGAGESEGGVGGAVIEAAEAQQIIADLQSAMDEDEAAIESEAEDSDGGNPKDSTVAGNKAKGNSAQAAAKQDAASGENSEAEPNAKELAACSRLSGQAVDKIMVVNKKIMPEIGAQSVLAIKLAGNKTELALDLVGEEGLKLKSICVFAAGNQTHFKLSTSVSLDQFIFVGRGNLTMGTVEVAENTSIGQVFGSLAGNQSTLTISGAGTYDCSKVVQKHANTTLSCK